MAWLNGLVHPPAAQPCLASMNSTAVKWAIDSGGLQLPVAAAVGGVPDDAAVADGPTLLGVDKRHVAQRVASLGRITRFASLAGGAATRCRREAWRETIAAEAIQAIGLRCPSRNAQGVVSARPTIGLGWPTMALPLLPPLGNAGRFPAAGLYPAALRGRLTRYRPLAALPMGG